MYAYIYVSIWAIKMLECCVDGHSSFNRIARQRMGRTATTSPNNDNNNNKNSNRNRYKKKNKRHYSN